MKMPARKLDRQSPQSKTLIIPPRSPMRAHQGLNIKILPYKLHRPLGWIHSTLWSAYPRTSNFVIPSPSVSAWSSEKTSHKPCCGTVA